MTDALGNRLPVNYDLKRSDLRNEDYHGADIRTPVELLYAVDERLTQYFQAKISS